MNDKDEIIQDLRTQLDKHSQIAAMIHNLSSGKIPGNGLNFSSWIIITDPLDFLLICILAIYVQYD